MPSITVHNIPGDVYLAIRERAAQQRRSMAAEIRTILEEATKPVVRVKLGSLLVDIGRDAGLTEQEAEAFNKLRV
ncbi:FitA-like ribbon-helix-helix domain-containing protein [Xanthomonas arboricola]|uniref:FitA-like ribbon-helix-helix domain-containing protein n=1 Tax=Xanthomonas arboricola TaxID=56448 RepID=UPI000CEE14FE|nr:plasmid stabilization protein [Xanthomonas arboricola]PPU36805.1 plasmid stabilization protein [Xanthomonas arboricola pv. populi]